MPQAYAAILGDPAVCVPLRLAWEESQPGTTIAHGEFYVGEFVISHAKVYLIAPNGQVIDVGETAALLT